MLKEYHSFSSYLKSFGLPCMIGLDVTANYHRLIAYHLGQTGFKIHLISALSAARTREALHNSWDKNDPKDAQVILHLLNTRIVQTYYDPLVNHFNEIQKVSKNISTSFTT